MTRHNELVARGRAIVQTARQLYIDLDVESDGPAGIGSLLSVGAVSPFEGDEDFYAELRPTDKPGLPHSRKFCEKHGLERARLLQEGEDPREVMLRLRRWVNQLTINHGKSGAVLVAYPSWFDFGLINTTMLEHGLPNPFGLNGHCVQSLAMALGIHSYNWEGLSRANLPPELLPPWPFTHNALQDALYQQAMHFAMVGLLKEQQSAR